MATLGSKAEWRVLGMREVQADIHSSREISPLSGIIAYRLG